jgi:FKBP-type peptidyl-prolyl cis-trans isomerase
MHRTTLQILTFSLAGTLLCGTAFAQSSSAPESSQAPASTSTTPKAQKPSTTTGTGTTKSGTTAAKKPAATPFTLKTEKDKQSYAIGLNLGRSMKRDELGIDPDVLARGLKDGFGDKKALMTDEEMQSALMQLKTDVQKRQQEKYQATLEKNKAEGDAFLAANKAKPDVVTLPSGLQYKVLQAGTGPKPTATDTVECNYKGTLIDGTEFDSSYKRGQTAKFPVNQVIKGWTEALQLMPVGSKWELFIPPSLGYGERGAGNGPIGPNATLVFEVELVSVQPKPEAVTPPAHPQPQTPPPAQPQAAPQGQQPQAQPQTQPQTQTPPQPPPQAKPQ